MTFVDKIREDTKQALREKNEARVSVLRMLSSAMHNRALEKRAKSGKEETLSQEEAIAVLRSEVKKRRDAIAEFGKGGRQDLVEKETAELKILETYMPQELPDEEIEKIVKEVIAGMGGAAPKDFGKVMGETMRRMRGSASGNRVGDMVRKLLGVA